MITDISSFLAVWQWGCITWSSMWSLESDIQLWNYEWLCSRTQNDINEYIHKDLKTTLDFQLQLTLCLRKLYNDAKWYWHNRFLWAYSVTVHCHAAEPPLDQWQSISSLNSNLICALWQIRTGISKEETNSPKKKNRVFKSPFLTLPKAPYLFPFDCFRWERFIGVTSVSIWGVILCMKSRLLFCSCKGKPGDP